MPTFLDEKRAEIDRRLEELKPLVAEYQVLERAKAALDSVDATPTRAARRTPARRRGGTTEAALKFIRENPGATVRQIAEGIGLKHANYLYRVLPTLQEQGRVRKEGKGWAAG